VKSHPLLGIGRRQIVVTPHRQFNVDNREKLEKILNNWQKWGKKK